MDTIGREELGTLLRAQGSPCVSIYMPSHRSGPEIRQDPIRLKNLLRRAEERLAELGTPPPEARAVLAPAEALLGDSAFWRQQGDGLALFLSPASSHHYRLPVDFQELLVVTRRFHLKPLLPLFAHDSHFYILALSQNQVRLYRGSPSAMGEVALPSLPGGLDETLLRFDAEKQGEIHSGTAIREYCRSINGAVSGHLAGESAPLVAASVEFLFAAYREVNTYPALMDDCIPGNPESLRPDALHARGMSVAARAFGKAVESALERYRRLAGTDRSSSQIGPVLRAAHEGRVDTLLVAVGIQRWGAYGPSDGSLLLRDEPEPGDEDLLDRAAVSTLASGGSVYAVRPEEMPLGAPLAAIFRY